MLYCSMFMYLCTLYLYILHYYVLYFYQSILFFQLVSSVSGKEVTVVASKLLALRSFLEKNTQFTYSLTSQNQK